MANLTVYTRSRGPICYEKQLLDMGNEKTIDELVHQLLVSHLRWYWESSPSHCLPDYYRDHKVPQARPLTCLMINNATALMDDFKEVDLEVYGRFIALFGVDGGELRSDSLKDALTAFTHAEQGPIRIAITRIEDVRPQYIFVPHNQIEPVRLLLEQWGIMPSNIKNAYLYKRLRLAKLESLYKIDEGKQ
jgi:hypothetical protein